MVRLAGPCTLKDVLDSTICQDTFEVLDWLPAGCVDLLFADPPYNLTKSFNGRTFCRADLDQYEQWLDSWVSRIRRPFLSSTSPGRAPNQSLKALVR